MLGLRRLLLFLATFFRGALLGSRTLWLGCLRGYALGRGGLVVVLLLEQRTLPLEGLLLEHLRLRLLLEGALALQGLLLLLGLLLLTFLTVSAGFFLQRTPLGPALYT